MQIQRDLLEKLAALAHLNLDEAQLAHYLPRLQQVLSYLETIAELEAALPERDQAPESPPLVCPERPDEPAATGDVTPFLAQAPRLSGSAFKVPRIID